MAASRRQLARLLEALEEAGYGVAGLDIGEPLGVLLEDFERDRRLPLRIYLGHLGEERLRRGSRRALLPPSGLPKGEVATDVTLILGYDPDLDTFAAWQPEAHLGLAPRSSIRVPTDELLRASEHGLGVHVRQSRLSRRPAEIITTFRPDHVRSYIEAMPQLRSLRENLEEAGPAAAPEMREVALEILGSQSLPSEVAYQAVDLPEMEEMPVFVKPRRPEREVGTGFATRAGEAIEGHETLRPASTYLFWFKVGEPVAHSIEQTREELPIELLPDRASLAVALFGFEEELELDPDASLGHLAVDDEGAVSVSGAVVEPQDPTPQLGDSLFFPVRTPAHEGEARLRCNVYCDGVLVQSRLVTARVARTDAPGQGVQLRSELEYSLSHSLHSAQLATLPGADLSLMMNGDKDRQQFRFFSPGDDGKEPFKADSELDAHTVAALIEYCRKALRLTSWGSEEEWAEGIVPRYQHPPSPEQLRLDLARLATRGRLSYVKLIDPLVGGKKGRLELEERTRRPGRIEIAAAPDRFVPAAMFYDSPLTVGANLSEFTLCEDFVAARAHPSAPLEDCDCLSGGCPSWEDPMVVCPGGFWGFRHSIGWPVTLDGDALGVLAYKAAVKTAIACAEDLVDVAQHRADVEGLLGPLDIAPDGRQLLELLRKGLDEVVYLYCHGGETPGGAAFIRVGEPNGLRLTLNELWELGLEGRNSLVFLNGCQTTAVAPDKQFDLVRAFVDHGGALGVIGTEITVFEPMAAPFAMDFLRSFVVDGATVGEAIRHARLATLKEGNPLGLAYVPFALGGTALERLAS